MFQFVPSAMWPGYRGGTSSKRATLIHQRDQAYHSSAKLGSHQQMRYHRYIRFAIGNTPSQQYSRSTHFHKLQVLGILDSLCLFFMMTSRLGSGVLLERL